jgi:VanZ family protein
VLKALLKIALMLAAIGALLFALLDPSNRLPEIQPPWDKACHFAAFYALTIWAQILFSPRFRVYPLIVLLVLSGLSEYLQGLPMIHRDAEVSDSVADILGMTAACLPAWIAHWRA